MPMRPGGRPCPSTSLQYSFRPMASCKMPAHMNAQACHAIRVLQPVLAAHSSFENMRCYSESTLHFKSVMLSLQKFCQPIVSSYMPAHMRAVACDTFMLCSRRCCWSTTASTSLATPGPFPSPLYTSLHRLALYTTQLHLILLLPRQVCYEVLLSRTPWQAVGGHVRRFHLCAKLSVQN